jgi:hypothetical protein
MYKLIQYINEKWELNRGLVHPLTLLQNASVAVGGGVPTLAMDIL